MRLLMTYDLCLRPIGTQLAVGFDQVMCRPAAAMAYVGWWNMGEDGAVGSQKYGFFLTRMGR